MRGVLTACLAVLLARVANGALVVDSVRVDGATTNGTFVDPGAVLELSFAASLSSAGAAKPRAGSATQTAVRVVVSSTETLVAKGEGDLWDSGWVQSSAQTGIRVEGKAWASSAWFRVQVRDGLGADGPLSGALWLRKPMLSETDPARPKYLTAPGPIPSSACEFYQRRPTALVRAAVPARPEGVRWVSGELYVAALGYGVVTVNGASPDPDAVLDTAWTTYSERVMYNPYDVSALLPANGSELVLGAELGSGWWSPLPMRLFGRFNLRDTMDAVGLPMLWLEARLADSAGGEVVVSTATARPDGTAPGGVVWSASRAGAVVFENVYLGQVTDNRRLSLPQLAGWRLPGFSPPAGSWGAPVPPAVNGTTGRLVVQDVPPVRAFVSSEGAEEVEDRPLSSLRPEVGASAPVGGAPAPTDDDDASSPGTPGDGRPVSITEPSPGVFVADFGSDRTGVVDILSVRGPAGTEVNVSYAELLYPSGHIDPVTILAGAIGRWNGSDWGECARVPAVPIDTVVLAGGGAEESHHPRLTWRVFRYAQITGWPVAASGPPTADSLRRVVVHTDVSRTGHFRSPLPLLSAVRRLADRAYLNNWQSIQSDCPGRERLGYGADMLVSAPAAARAWDVDRLYRKRVRDYGDAQRPNGGMPETAPFVGIATCDSMGGGAGPAAWGAGHLFVASLHRRLYGGTALAQEQLPAGQRFVALLNASAVGGVLDNGLRPFDLRASYEPGCTGVYESVQGTSTMASQAAIAAELLDATGGGGAAGMRALARQAQTALRATLLNATTGTVGGGSMDEQILALGFGALGNGSSAAAAVGSLRRFWEGNGTLVAGPFIAFAHEQAVSWGLGERLWAWVTNSTYPSYGFFLRFGATAMPEHWDAPQEDDSWSHAWLGSVSQVLTDHVAGVQPGGVGSSSLVAAPQPFGLRADAVPGAPPLRAASATVGTPRGAMGVSWSIDGDGGLSMNVTLPPSSEGVALVPLMTGADGGSTKCTALRPTAMCSCRRLSRAEALAVVASSTGRPSQGAYPPFDAWSLEDSTECAFAGSGWPA